MIEKEYTGRVYFRDDDGILFIALSYIGENGETQTDTFLADETTGEIIK